MSIKNSKRFKETQKKAPPLRKRDGAGRSMRTSIKSFGEGELVHYPAYVR
jgi:hypothetical protein